jgi:ribosomal protein S12 methylthiotransferase accessory factor
MFAFGSLCGDVSYLGMSASEGITGSCSLTRDGAIAGAIREAIERYSAGIVPVDELIIAPYITVKASAIAPWSLTLYDIQQYKQPDFCYQPLNPSDPIGWVIGYSLTRDTPVLVPGFAVYLPYESERGEVPVVQQISTGLACGNTLEEAILSGICEVIERDASMLMWLQSRHPPKVSLEATPNSSLAKQALSRFGRLASAVSILDTTTDFGIPSYVAFWDGLIGSEQGLVFASAANLSPEYAVVGALTELAQCMTWVRSLIEHKKPSADPLLGIFTRIEDHVLWPARLTNRDALQFLLSNDNKSVFENSTSDYSQDILQNIRICVERIATIGHEVIVVDITSPDVRDIGLHVVRVIIPGAQPLFFGSNLHRISERAQHNPYQFRARADINLHPHPFP